MISNLVRSTLSFSGGEPSAVRNSYKAKLEQNSQIAQAQNSFVQSSPVAKPSVSSNSLISMQGNAQGQKLDIIA